MSNWIPVSERLPITEETIVGQFDVVRVITFDGLLVSSGFFQAGNAVRFWANFEDANVTHWQPLPEPPHTVPEEKK